MSRRRSRDRDGLAGLEARLAGGVALAAPRGRPGGWPVSDEAALAGWPADDDLAILAGFRDLSWNTRWRETGGAAIADRLVADLRGSRSRLIGMLLAPAAVLDGLRDRSCHDPVRAWAGLCWVADAAWTVTRGRLDGTDYSPGDRDLLVPLAARLRFLTLSEPMRWRAEASRAWWSAAPADREFDGSELVRRVLGDAPWHVLAGQCREARRAWLACLDAYQSHPLLARSAPGEIEDELAAVVFRHPRPRRAAGAGSGPLALSDRPLSEVAPLSAEDAVIVSDATERHLLPRFQLGAVAALAAYSPAVRGRIARLGLAAAVVAAAVTTVVYAALLHVHLAAWLAVIPYLLIAAGVVAFGSAWAAPWLLRMPAASTIGVFALVSLLPGGWLAAPPGGWAASVVLGGAAVGYLLVEARNHGVSAPQALLRSAGVALVGAVHALLVSLLGLVLVAPAFVGNGRRLAELWSHPGGFGQGGLLLALATAWCLAVGVFSQILWDDRPITAPLAHLQWRSAETSQ